MTLYAGTSGFSYKEWVGGFYPAKTRPADMLPYYATRLNSVEINNTFYRMPKSEMLAGWREKTEGVNKAFRFSIKAPQRITHRKRLRSVEDDVTSLYRALEVLENALGVVLFQLPPYFQKDAECLRAFLSAQPTGVRVAFEFRHRSWYDEEIDDLLSNSNTALCVNDDDKTDVSFSTTADFGYLRLRRSIYSEDDLKRWRDFIRKRNWDPCYVFFKHEDDCGGALLAEKLLNL